MKVCLYFENYEEIKQSGIGKALEHQTKALSENGISYTLNPDDDYDILHINTIFFRSNKIIKKARKKGAKVIYHAHSTPEDTKNSFLFSNVKFISNIVKNHLLSLYKKADYIITPTPYSKMLLENHGIKTKITALSNGIDLSKFSKDAKKGAAFRKHFNLSPTQKVVVSAGLWIKRKGILDFVKVASLMPDVTFIWFGYTDPMLIPKEINDAIKNKPENCLFPGYMSGDVFEGAFSEALFFFPSLEETEGIVILEALASKAPTVIRDIPVYDGWMQNEVNCFKGKDVNDFVKLISSNTQLIKIPPILLIMVITLH